MRPLLRSVAAIAAATLVMSCADSVAPRTVSLTISATSGGMQIDTVPGGFPVISCAPTITLSAEGNTDAEITDGRLYFYTGADRTTTTDSSVVSHSDLAYLLGASEVLAGKTLATQIIFYDGLPFEMDFVVNYTPKGGTAQHSAKTHLVCGPTPSADASGPSVTTQTRTSHDPVQPGDTIFVDYQASSAQGLWETVVHVSGIMDSTVAVAHRLAPSASGTFALAIPSDAPLGDVYVDVAVLDAAGYYVTRRVAGISLTDVTPPTITVASLWGQDWNGNYAGLVGQVAQGDTIGIIAAAVDNSRPAMLIYQFTGPSTLRDSIAFPDGTTDNALVKARLALGPEWIGSPRLTVWVRDRFGNLSDSVTSAPDSLRVYPTVSAPSVQGTLAVPTSVPAYDERNGRLFSPAGTQILAYSLAAAAVTDSLSSGTAAAGVDVLPGEDSLVVGLPQAHGFGIVDLTQPAHTLTTIPVAQLDTFPGLQVVRVSAMAGGRILLWLNAAVNDQAAIAYDLATGTSAFVPGCSIASTSGSEVARSADHRRVLIGDSGTEAIYDAGTGVCGAKTWVDNPDSFDRPYGWADSTGSHFTFGTTIVDAQGDSVWSLPTNRGGTAPMAMIDATHAWVRQGAGVSLLDLTTGLFSKHVHIPFGAWTLMLSPDRQTLVILGETDGYATTVPVMTVDVSGL